MLMTETGDGGAAGRIQYPPAILGNPTVIAGVGVTHLRYPVHKA